MIGSRFTKALRWILPLVSFFALLPLAFLLGDPLATHAYDSSIDTSVLLLWPDHIELRKISTLTEFSPQPSGAAYKFLVPPERLAWVRKRLAEEPHNPDAGWIIRIKQLDPSKQRIQLEIIGDGFWGMVYEATPDRIAPWELGW